MRNFAIFFTFALLFLGSVSEAGAKGFDRVRFVNTVKEYAYKIAFPEIRCKEEKIHAEDMKNLRAKILDMVESYPESRGAMNELVRADREIGEILESDTFVSDLIKFENIDKSSSNTVPPKPCRINKYSLYFRYSRNFNPFHKSKIMKRLEDATKGEKSATDEANDIWNDFDSINDEESMNKLAPSIINRSVSLLTKPVSDDILDPNKANDLFNASARCTIYLKYGFVNDISNDTMYNEYSDFVKKVYKSVKINDYKYASILAMENVCFVTNKFDNALEYAISVKDDAFNSFSSFYKASIIDYICSLTINPIANFPINDKYFNIGYEYSKLFYDIIDNYEDQSLTDDEKYLYKLFWRGSKVAEILAYYSFIDESLTELDYIINSKPPTTYTDDFNIMIKQFTERKNVLITNATNYPYKIDIIIDVEESKNIKFENLYKVNGINPIFEVNDKINNVVKFISTLNVNNKIKKELPKNLSLVATYEYIFENDDVIKNFYRDPKQDGSNRELIHDRGNSFGFIRNEEYNKPIGGYIIDDIVDNKFNFIFKHSYFGGDKFKIIIKSLPPYNVNKEIILEVWKFFDLKLYSMDDKLNPDVSGINDIFKSCFVEFNPIVYDKKIEKINYIFYKKNKEINDPTYILKFLEILKNHSVKVSEIKNQHKYINIIGCNKMYTYATENENEKAYGSYYRHYTIVNGEFVTPSKYDNKLNKLDQYYMSTCFMSYGFLRENNVNEMKTLVHELCHSFGLDHLVDGFYRHSDPFNCVMNSGHEVVNFTICDNCKYLIRNGSINITRRFFEAGQDMK